MKRFGWLVLVVCVWAAGCDDDAGTAPSSLPLVFSALLSPAHEIPAVANAEAQGRGAFQVTFVPTRDASGNLTAARATFFIQLTGFPGGVRVTGAHIHSGTSNVTGPVRVDSGITLGAGVTLADGTLEMTIPNITVDPAIAEAIFNNPSAWYFNIHSTTNPGGFSRGQLSRVQ